jgi:blocked early in transport 1
MLNGSDRLNQRAAHSNLFSNYASSSSAQADRPSSRSYSPFAKSNRDSPLLPVSNKQLSTSELSELENQNDEQVSGLLGKVSSLKSVSCYPFTPNFYTRLLTNIFKLTVAIGDEIRSSTAFADDLNDSFGNTSRKLKGTMNRMLRMAQRSTISWKVWLGFFAAVVLLFWYVWLS